MGHTVRTDPVDVDPAVSVANLHLVVLPEGDRYVVSVSGELDRASRDQLVAASIAGDHHETSIDLTAVTFMDCSGYAGLVTSRLLTEETGRSLTIRGITGQPKRLVDMIERLEAGDSAGRVDTPAVTGYELCMLGTRASRRGPGRQAGRA
jgi:anti-anti-sigma factor